MNNKELTKNIHHKTNMEIHVELIEESLDKMDKMNEEAKKLFYLKDD